MGVAVSGVVGWSVVVDRGDASASDGQAGPEVLRCPHDGRGDRLPVSDGDCVAGSAGGVRAVADGVDLASSDGVRRDVGSCRREDHHRGGCGGDGRLVAVGGLHDRACASARDEHDAPHRGLDRTTRI